MMPQLITIRVRGSGRRSVRLWIPVLPVLLVLSPLLLVALLVLVVGLAVVRINPLRGVPALWGLFCATRGVHLEINDRQNAVWVNVR
jgi:hypothetical protein